MNDRKPTVENKLQTVKIKTPSVEDSAPSLNDVSESSNINTVDLPTLMRSDSKASPPIQRPRLTPYLHQTANNLLSIKYQKKLTTLTKENL